MSTSSNTKQNPMVSVVMITYGHENYIEEAINGVLMQSCNFDIELIIANDKSPDDTDHIVKRIISEHPKSTCITYTNHQENLGMMPNIIWAFQQATGKYIAFCEGDDYWTDPLKLQKQVDLLYKNPNSKFCFTDVDIFMQPENKLYRSRFKNDKSKYYVPKTIEDILVNKLYLASCTWLFEKDLLQVFEENSIFVDGTFAIAMDFIMNTDFVFLPESTATYRSLEESASHSKSLEKKYNVQVGLLHTQLYYIDKYKLDSTLIDIVTKDFYRNVFLDLMYAEEGRENVIKKLREDEEFSVDFFVDAFKSAKEEVNKYKESTSFKVGNSIITKIQWFKNLLKFTK